jgi:hypothetical protein
VHDRERSISKFKVKWLYHLINVCSANIIVLIERHDLPDSLGMIVFYFDSNNELVVFLFVDNPM